MKNIYHLFWVMALLLVCYTGSAQSEPSSAGKEDIAVSAFKKTGAFTPNVGQVLDENYQPVTHVLAKSSLPGLDIYLTETGVSYVLLNYELDSAASQHPVYITNNNHFKVHYSRVDVNLVGATLTKSQLEFKNEETYKASYYYGDIRAEAVSSYKDVTVKNVYPGIDWHWFINSKGQPEYDFVVHAGYSSNVIKMQYLYADITPGIDNILISTRNGALREGTLKAFVAKQQVTASYNYNEAKKEVTFTIGAYNTANDLVIDPPLQLQWSGQYGGTFADGLRGVSTSALNNAYLAGYTTSTNFPGQSGGGGTYFDGTFNGTVDAVILKVSPAQALLWATYMGGTGNDFANSVAVSPVNNNIYIAGGARQGFPLVSAPNVADYNDNNAVLQDAFVARFNTQQQLKWSTFYGGPGTDEALKVYADSASTYIAGYADNTIDTVGSIFNMYTRQVTALNLPNPYIVQFDAQDRFKWATAIPDSTSAYATSLVKTGSSIVLCGYTNSSVYMHLGNSLPATYSHGGTDGFIVRFNNGMLVNERLIGGSGSDYITDITKGVNSAYTIAGRTNSINYPVRHSIGAQFVQNNLAGSYDAFITRMNLADTITWSTYYGGTGNDAATAITTDVSFKYIVTGFTFSGNFPVDSPPTGGYYQPYLKGNSDGFIASFTQLGLRTYSTYKGDSCYEYPADVAVTNDASLIYICGEGFVGCNNSIPDTLIGNGGGANGFCWLLGGVPGSCISLGVTGTLYPCPDSANGWARAVYSGGISPYTIEWSSGEHTDTATELTPGEAYLTIVDSAGCAADYIFNLNALAIVNNSQPADCNIIGIASVLPVYGNLPFTYNWGSSLPAQQSVQVSPGTYPLTVTDNRSCSVTANIMVGYRNTTGIIATVVQQPYCENANGIVAAFHQLSGTYVTVPWADSSNIRLGYWDTIYNQAPGSYYIDTNDCVYNPYPNNYPIVQLFDSALNNYPDMHIELSGPPVGCGNEMFSNTWLYVYLHQGGNAGNPAGFNFNWSTGYTSIGENALLIDTVGVYSLTVTDLEGCRAYASINVDEYDTLKIVDYSYFSDCVQDVTTGIYFEVHNVWRDGSNIPPYDNLTYEWDTPNGQFPNPNIPLAYGNYFVTVTDGYTGCSATEDWTYEPIGQGYQYLHFNQQAVFCSNVFAIVSVTVDPPLPGKMHYSWYDHFGNQLPVDTNVISATDYQYTVYVTSDSSNQTYYTCVYVQGMGAYNVFISPSNYTCSDNGVTLSTFINYPFDGGLHASTYQWLYNDTILPVTTSGFQALQSGVYSVIVSYNGCYDTATINVTAAPLFQYTYTAEPRCNSDSTDIYFNVSGGLAPFVGQMQPVTVAPGTYSYTLRDARNCIKNISVTTTHHQYVEGSYVYESHCQATDSVTISATGGIPPYVGTGTYAVLAGNNRFIVADSLGCTDTIYVTATQTTAINSEISREICSGNSYVFKGQSLSTAGTYTDTLQTVNGCDSIVTLNLTVLPALTGSYSDVMCEGYSYLFNNQQLTQAGAYTDTLQGVNGCDSIVTLNLTLLPALTGNYSDAVCNGYSYLFNNQQLTQAGAYTDTLQGVNGCDSIVTLNLMVLPALTGSFSDAVCDGYSYLFNGQPLTQAGAYADTLQGVNGCDSIVTLTLYTKYGEAVTIDTTIQQGSTYILPDGSTTGAAGIYTDTLLAANGCDSVITTNLSVVSGVGEVATLEGFTLQPNPASSYLYVGAPVPLTGIVVYNTTGQQVIILDRPVAQNNTYLIDVQLLAAGTYVIEVKGNGAVARRRWVKM